MHFIAHELYFSKIALNTIQSAYHAYTILPSFSLPCFCHHSPLCSSVLAMTASLVFFTSAKHVLTSRASSLLSSLPAMLPLQIAVQKLPTRTVFSDPSPHIKKTPTLQFLSLLPSFFSMAFTTPSDFILVLVCCLSPSLE